MGCSPWGHKELGTTEQLTLTYFHQKEWKPEGKVLKEDINQEFYIQLLGTEFLCSIEIKLTLNYYKLRCYL